MPWFIELPEVSDAMPPWPPPEVPLDEPPDIPLPEDPPEEAGLRSEEGSFMEPPELGVAPALYPVLEVSEP